MLKHVIIFLLLCFTYTLQSQVLISILLGDKLNTGQIEFGLDGGLSLSTLYGIPEVKTDPDYNLGFYFDFKMKDTSWLFNTGVRVKSTMGAKGIPVYPTGDPDLDSSFASGMITRKLNYFNVPVTMKYTFKNSIYLQGGIQLGLKYKATDVFTNTIQEEEDLSYRLSVKDDYHPLDAGLLGGVGYRLQKGNGMNIGMQYYFGMVDVRISDAGPNEFNRTLYVNVGIPIGKGKAMAKESEQSSE